MKIELESTHVPTLPPTPLPPQELPERARRLKTVEERQRGVGRKQGVQHSVGQQPGVDLSWESGSGNCGCKQLI